MVIIAKVGMSAGQNPIPLNIIYKGKMEKMGVNVRKFTFSNHIDTETRVNKEQNKSDHIKKY